MRANELRARSSQLEAAQVKGGHLEENLRLQRKKTEKMAMELEASKERLSKAEQGLKESLATNQAKVRVCSRSQAVSRAHHHKSHHLSCSHRTHPLP